MYTWVLPTLPALGFTIFIHMCYVNRQAEVMVSSFKSLSLVLGSKNATTEGSGGDCGNTEWSGGRGLIQAVESK